MNFAILSAIALICVDASLPAPAVALAAVQAAPDSDPDPAPPAEIDDSVALRGVQTQPIEIDETAAPGEDAADETAVSAEELFSEELVFEGESDDQVVTRLQDYLESVTTLTGDFTQVAPSGAISSGKFYLRRPGLLRFEYDPPTPLLIVANGGMVYVRDEALETTDSYPASTTPLKFLLRKKVDLDDAVVVGVDRGVDNLAVTFASTDAETEGELTVIVSAPEMQLTRWIVRDIQNGITVVALDNVTAGRRLSNRLFETPDAGGMFLDN